jgi:hypothetical protein
METPFGPIGDHMSATPDLPEFFSARRAEFLSGLGEPAIDKLPRHGGYKQVARVDLEHLLGRRLTAADWDQATVAINRRGMAKRAQVEATNAVV